MIGIYWEQNLQMIQTFLFVLLQFVVHCSRSEKELTIWRPLLPYGYSYKLHPVPDRVKPSFVIFDIRALWRSGLSVRVPGCQKLQKTA